MTRRCPKEAPRRTGAARSCPFRRPLSRQSVVVVGSGRTPIRAASFWPRCAICISGWAWRSIAGCRTAASGSNSGAGIGPIGAACSEWAKAAEAEVAARLCGGTERNKSATERRQVPPGAARCRQAAPKTGASQRPQSDSAWEPISDQMNVGAQAQRSVREFTVAADSLSGSVSVFLLGERFQPSRMHSVVS